MNALQSIPPPPPGYKRNPTADDDSDIPQPIAAVRTGSNVGDKVNIGGKDMYVVGQDAQGRPTLDVTPPPPPGYSVNRQAPPLSRDQADAAIRDAGTMGMGTFNGQVSAPNASKPGFGTSPVKPGRSFAQSDLVDPQGVEFGGPLKKTIFKAGSKNPLSRDFFQTQQVPAGPSEYVERSQVPEARYALEHSGEWDPLGEELSIEHFNEDPMLAVRAVLAANKSAKEGAAQFGGDVGASLVPKSMPKAKAVARGVGSFAGGLINPETVALGGIGGKIAPAVFTAMGAHGTYEGIKEL